MKIDYEAISVDFTVNGRKWRDKEDNTFVPTAGDIEKAVNKMREALENAGGDEVTITVGGLSMQKLNGEFHLYNYVGTYGEES